MMVNYREKIAQKSEGLLRQVMVRCLSAYFPLYIINEYPKSGGTWLGQMLGEALHIPFPRNCMPSLTSSIMHDHYYHPWGMKNVVVLFRDGRDVMVSWYYHSLFYNDRSNARLVDRVRKDLVFEDYENIIENLPTFIEYSFTCQKHPNFSWADFVRQWHGRKGVVYCRYEDIRMDAEEELKRIVLSLTGKYLDDTVAYEVVSKYSFARQAGRQPGEENQGSFMRKGIVGDWENHFNQEARDIFHFYAGQELIQLDYERDSRWVEGNK